MKRVLNVGGNDKSIALPPQYAGFEHLLLDIQPGASVEAVAFKGTPTGEWRALFNLPEE